MLTEREIAAAIGSTAHGADGDKIGTVERFFVDDRTGTPTWVAVSTGLFGTRHSLVPVHSASFTDGRLVLPVSRDAVRASPEIGDTGHLGPDEEALLRRHYGLEVAGAGQDAVTRGGTGPASADAGPGEVRSGEPAAGGGVATARESVAGEVGTPEDTVRTDTVRTDAVPPVAQDAAGRHAAPSGTDEDMTPGTYGAMTRSEERLRISGEQVPARRVRLVKYVVTEEVQVTVPIRREEIRIEEVPLDAPERMAGEGTGESLVPDGSAAGALPEEIILHAERPVVSVEVVPVERVRLRSEVVQGSEQVTERVQREQIGVDQDRLPGSPA
jgi:uncharacterized protein (TIGR02271 family)